MAPRGRGGGFRGRESAARGSRGRGRGGRGGGRGRGSSRAGPYRRFDANRLAEDDTDENSASESEQEDEAVMDVDSDDEASDEEEQNSRPYAALLESFSNEAEPTAKRRKTGHQPGHSSEKEAQPSANGAKEEEESETGDEERDPDRVDEGEGQDAEEDLEEEGDDDSDDGNDPTDSFDSHFANPKDQNVSPLITASKKGDWDTKRQLIPPWRATATFPRPNTSHTIPEPISNLDDLKLKAKLKETAAKCIKFGDLHQTVGPLLFGYRDLLFCDEKVKNAHSLRQLVCLHALNHVFKTRDRVIKDNYRLAKDSDSDLELRDQGFTRPKVLFLLPTRHSCVRTISMIRDLCEPDQEENRKRFDESYLDTEQTFGPDRPEDFKHLFEGNDDDMFRLGVKFTRKTVKYFAQFYNSDILFASPLGLRMALGSEEDKKSIDYDFLSSIELVVVDQADALLMQNWEHVEYIFEHLNLQPKEAHGCDFSRVRNWYLEEWAKYFRQTVILSGFNTPELSELQRAYCHNWAGKVRLQPEYQGVLQQLGVKAKQTFSRFQSSSIERDPDARFEYFTSAILPSLTKRAKDSSGTLIFIPSYLDFVRVRNYFATSAAVSDVSFGTISEYADVPEASRARSHFLSGRHKVLLYTERAHHFRRHQLRGVQRVIFYGLPDNPIFYREIAGDYLSKSEQQAHIAPRQGSVRAIFSKYDVMKLERIVGSKRVGKMIQDRGDTFDFV